MCQSWKNAKFQAAQRHAIFKLLQLSSKLADRFRCLANAAAQKIGVI